MSGLGRLAACLLIALGIGPLAVAPAAGQTAPEPEPAVIQDIRVDGAQRIEAATVRSYMTVRPGDPFDPIALDDTLKALFNTGLFADVLLRREGATLVVAVVENPIINRIAFEGNARIEDAVLEAEVTLRPRVVYTRTRVQNDVARLQEIYRRSGRFAATVEPKIIQLEQNRVDLVFEIDEGELTGVERISFIGNDAFSDSALRGEIRTEETVWYDLFSVDDNYDPDRLAFDQELLRQFYLSEGYADFRVVSAVAELTPDREAFFITFTLDEGERYDFGEIDIVSRLPDLNVEVLFDVLTTEPEDTYSNTAVEETIANLTDAVGDQQYAFVDVRPLITRDRDQRLINITYEINEGPRVFVERIDVSGNVRTEDRVIRREFELVEGDPFNASLLRRSEARVRNLGFFEQVEVNTLPGSTPDQTIVDVQVQEQSTGELSIGAGFSTAEGPLGTISLRERNLLGTGQDLAISGTLSASVLEADLSFTEPYFLGRDIAAGFDVFSVTRDNQDESSFDEFTLGFGLRSGFRLGPDLRQTLGYTLALRDIRDVDSSASRFIQEQEGETLTSAVRSRLTYDQLDSRISPTDGYILRGEVELAGLGGDVFYVRTTASGDYYYPLLENVILNIGGSLGQVTGLGEDVRINDRFFVGGGNLRGFEPAGIGPRDGNDDALGGNFFATGTAEVSFPLGLPEELGIRGRAFTDVGTLFGLDDEEISGSTDPADQIFDESSIRVSVGTGLSWNSPFGPIQIDVGFPVVQEDFDQTEIFRFSFGTRF